MPELLLEDVVGPIAFTGNILGTSELKAYPFASVEISKFAKIQLAANFQLGGQFSAGFATLQPGNHHSLQAAHHAWSV